MSGSSRVRACDFGFGPGSGFKMKPFYHSMCVCMQGPSKGDWKDTWSTNSKNRWKSFCEVGYVSVFQPFCCSGNFSKCLRCSWNPKQLWHSGTLLQPRRTVVTNFVPGDFRLFRRNPWQPLAEIPVEKHWAVLILGQMFLLLVRGYQWRFW